MENIQENELILEDTTGPGADNVATTDENLSFNDIFQQVELPSLARQIFSVVPLHGPTGAIFNIRKKKSTDAGWVDEATSGRDFVLLRNEVEVYPSEPINTSISKETIQDIIAQYGKSANEIIGKLLRGLSNEDENTKTLAFLNSKAKAHGNLTLSDSGNSETTMFELTKHVNDIILTINKDNLRSYQAFCVVPFTIGGAISGLSNYVGGKEGEKDEQGLFLAQIGQTKFYTNPDATSSTVYVGLKDANPSKSSAIFSPYAQEIKEAIDPNTGEAVQFIFNRYAITESPLHETDSEMLYKFDVV